MATDRVRAPRWPELERLRLDAGLSPAALAVRAGVDVQQVRRIESGWRIGRPETLKRIADVFGMTTTALLATRPTWSGAAAGEPAEAAA